MQSANVRCRPGTSPGSGEELVPGAPGRAHAVDDDLELAVIAGAVLAVLTRETT